MKTIFFLFLFGFLNIFYGQLKVTKSIDEAFLKSKKNNKLVLIELYNPECLHCMVLEGLLKNEKVYNVLNKNFLNYKINIKAIQKNDYDFLIKSNIKTPSIPYYFIYDKNKKLIFSYSPSDNEDSLVNFANKIQNPKYHYYNCIKRYKNGEINFELFSNLLNYYSLSNNYTIMDSISNKIFKSMDSSNYYSFESYFILDKYVWNLENDLLKFWFDNYDNMNISNKKFTIHDVKNTLKYKLHSFCKEENWGKMTRENKILLKKYYTKLKYENEFDLLMVKNNFNQLIEIKKYDEAFLELKNYEFPNFYQVNMVKVLFKNIIDYAKNKNQLKIIDDIMQNYIIKTKNTFPDLEISISEKYKTLN